MIINNFGIFQNETEIEFNGKTSTIIGENGTGKSSILFLIRYILDYKTRRESILEEQLNEKNKDSIIQFIFDTKGSDFTNSMLITENNEVYIKMIVSKNKELDELEAKFYLNEIEEIEFNANQRLPYDEYINLIYLDSITENNNSNWIKRFFSIKENISLIQSNINQILKNANNEIRKIDDVKELDEQSKKDISKIFSNNKFNMSLLSNIESNNIHKTLNFFSTDSNNNKINTHGSGFEKIFSIVAKFESTFVKGKINIVICDELENHLFYSYQKILINFLSDYKEIEQIIIVTHSPNIISLLPNSSITKIDKKQKARMFFISPKDNFFYYQVELNTSIFYDYILMVEGHSEKIFFEYLINTNEILKVKLKKKSIFIMNIQGISFKEKIELLVALGIKVIILTDNDFWSGIAQGIKRIFEILKIYNQNFEISDFTLPKQLENKKINEESVNEIFIEIFKKGKEYNVYTQEKFGDSFEESLFQEKLINCKKMDNLKKSKLKNLSKILNEINLTNDIIENSKYLFSWVKDVFSEND